MTYVCRTGLATLALAFALILPAGASPTMGHAVTHASHYDGFFKRLFHPKIDLKKTAGALTYPVKKAVVNGGKTVVKGGEQATSAAVGVAASAYIASKKPTIEGLVKK